MAWHAVVKEILIALPARYAPLLMAALASGLGLFTARAIFGRINERASFAYCFDSSVALLLQYDSMACASASIPVTAVTRGGKENVSWESTML